MQSRYHCLIISRIKYVSDNLDTFVALLSGLFWACYGLLRLSGVLPNGHGGLPACVIFSKTYGFRSRTDPIKSGSIEPGKLKRGKDIVLECPCQCSSGIVACALNAFVIVKLTTRGPPHVKNILQLVHYLGVMGLGTRRRCTCSLIQNLFPVWPGISGLR